MVRKKKQKTEERAPLHLVPTAGARLETTLDDELRTRELILFVRWIFGKPGLQIADYAGTLSSTVATTTANMEAQLGTARTVQAA
jgi:DNA-binding CsgD family transcriptional regulator